MADVGTVKLKRGLAQMLKGGVIMDVTNAEQAKIAEDAGACAVMALERVPSGHPRGRRGRARMSDPIKIKEIMETVTIPVMAKARIGHFVEAQVLEAPSVSTTLTRAKSSLRPTSSFTSTSTCSRSRLCAAVAIWARRSAGSARARR